MTCATLIIRTCCRFRIALLAQPNPVLPVTHTCLHPSSQRPDCRGRLRVYLPETCCRLSLPPPRKKEKGEPAQQKKRFRLKLITYISFQKTHCGFPALFREKKTNVKQNKKVPQRTCYKLVLLPETCYDLSKMEEKCDKNGKNSYFIQ